MPTRATALLRHAMVVMTAALAFTSTWAADTLRVCADPDNMPFSSNAPSGDKGMYVELAELVARKLDMQLEFVWWFTHNQRRAMRNTIQKQECDATFALPASTDWRARGVQKSQPFLDVGYVVVSAPGTVITSLESLRGKRIALQFSTTPHLVFAQLDGFKTSTHKDAAEVMAALTKGEADVGLLWGPVAGYDNKHKYQSRWQITPITGMDLSGQVVVGVRTGADGLKVRIDQALGDLQPEIRGLADKYGFPQTRAISFETAKPNSAVQALPAHARAVPASGWVTVSDKSASDKPAKKTADKPGSKKQDAAKANSAAVGATAATATGAAAATTAVATTAAASADPTVTAGRVRFNDQCSHCHGSDGASPIRERDVRRLSMRYDAAKWREVATTTIKNGRSDLGMPPWKDSLSEQNVQELLAFLATIQK